MGPIKKSTVDNILELINPTPVAFDPEDNDDTETAAKVVDNFSENSSGDDGVVSTFRKRNLDLLEDDDERYTGRKISRKSLRSQSESDFHPEQVSASNVTDSSGNEDGYDSSGNNSESAESSEGMKSYGKAYRSQQSETDDQLKDESFQHITTADVDGEIEKGSAVRNQLNLWDKLLECRIQMQKCLMNANKLPQHNTYKKFISEGGAKFSMELTKSKQSVTTLLDKLLQLESNMLASYSETKNLGKPKSRNNDKDLDEEIPSDTDEEVPSNADEVGEDTGGDKYIKSKPIIKNQKVDYGNVLSEKHKQYEEYRNSTIQKWNDKTRIAVGTLNSRNFSAFEQSTLKQIEQIMSNRQRLIRRSQLRRSNYEILGSEPDNQEKITPILTVDSLGKVEDRLKEYDVEIFDDGDFYHQLLRELIERKSTDVTDPIQLGKQWVELQKLRSKMKKKADTKATKGRKIRYVVHQKLVNFMAPVCVTPWNEEAKCELYNSLFGNNK